MKVAIISTMSVKHLILIISYRLSFISTQPTAHTHTITNKHAHTHTHTNGWMANYSTFRSGSSA